MPPTLSTWLAERSPAAAQQLSEAMFRPCYRFDVEVVQTGLDIGRLDRIIADVSIASMPGVPANAIRRRQLAYIAGRLCAEHAFAAWGVELAAPLGRGAAGQPLWPGNWSGSISHTAGQAFAAVAPSNGRYDIGIDAEGIVDDQTRQDILQVCVRESELRLVTACPDSSLAATVLFAAKEAYYKAIYRAVGRFVDFTEVVMSTLDFSKGRFEIGPAPEVVFARDLPRTCGSFAITDGVVLASLAPGY